MFSTLLGSVKTNDASRPLLESPSRRSHRRRSQSESYPHDEISSQDRSLQDGHDNFESENNLSDEDGDNEQDLPSLLPIFSSAHLDALPIFNLTHVIRTFIQQRCETTLSWDQLRSPQVSQFLVKPIQMQIRTSHFSRATLYALIANCLQFNKESQALPGNAGVLSTRGAVAELLAIRLLKEFTVRELIDALSYDFDPLQGMELAEQPQQTHRNSTQPQIASHRSSSARTSTLEVAIRAQAKHFLSHPLVVQHLEAIWAGSIVFHSAADNLHRMPQKPLPTTLRHYGATYNTSDEQQSSDVKHAGPTLGPSIRRSVTLYNPDDASLFKLSRLRVPRYRQIFSMLSYAGMLGLFLAVLVQRNVQITSLEVVFWFWSSGFMMDEILGFTEQGFSLYIMSVWNAFDIGILLLFSVYYILRLYNIFVADDQKQFVSDMAYDTLASTAVLLFPRLFSLLDHYRYFSQLLIAFRLMAQDLAAVLILIAITCSGFFVAFTLAFGKGAYDGASVAYSLFQILMGYTVGAWQAWDDYNILGQAILTLFLIICHFLVVTLLITVLTNSFMAIARNANEEHQFLFAINVLSMVKSDALFSYIAPSNIVGWIISPLRFIMPLRQYVKLNRSVIKLTHFPILWLVYVYEKVWLSWYALEPGNLIERNEHERGRQLQAFGSNSGNGQGKFHPSVRVREPSATTRYKDHALEEVFRQPYEGDTFKHKAPERTSRPSSAVDQWMNEVTDVASPLAERTRSILDRVDSRRPRLYRSATSLAISTKQRSTPRSMASEVGIRTFANKKPRQEASEHNRSLLGMDQDDLSDPNNSDQESDIASDKQNLSKSSLPRRKHSADAISMPTFGADSGAEYRATLEVPKPPLSEEQMKAFQRHVSQPVRPHAGHNRQASTNTIVFNPVGEAQSPKQSRRPGSPIRHRPVNMPTGDLRSKYGLDSLSTQRASRNLEHNVASNTVLSNIPAVQRDFKRAPPKSQFQGWPRTRRETSYDTLALDLASDIGDNRHIGMAHGHQIFNGFVPGSFSTHMNLATSMRRQLRRERDQNAEESSMMSRMVLARMNTLEESFKDILKEMKEWRKTSSRGGSENEWVKDKQNPNENAKPEPPASDSALPAISSP